MLSSLPFAGVLCVVVACAVAAGPAPPAGPVGPTGPQGPAGPPGECGGCDGPNRRLVGHLMLDGVPGGPFDISAYKFAASFPQTGAGASKVTFSEVSVTTTTTAARAVMFRRLATGRATRGVLQMLDQTGGSVIATYTMETLYLVSDTVVDDGSSGSRPVETFTFLFTRVTIDSGGVSVCWDFNLNTAC
jgi:hypothetical protein